MRTAFIPSWLDDLQLDVYQFRLYCHVLRRGELYASVESICQTCGFDRKKLFQTIVSLEAKSLLSVTREKGKTNRIKALQPVPKTEQEVCRKRNTKDTPLKESPIKEALPLIPMAFPFDSPEFKETWQMWEDERKKRKKPLSETAIKIQIKRMNGFTEKEIIHALEEAMEKRWATIYPKKDKATNQPRPTAQPTKPRSIYD